MEIKFEVNPTEKDTQTIYDGLVEFNEPMFGDLKVENYACFIRNQDGKILGGVTGGIADGVALLGYLWVDNSLRGQGVGKRIIETIESKLKAMNVVEIHLDTYNFQAPEFYIKMGFKEVARFNVMKRRNVEKIFFIKEL